MNHYVGLEENLFIDRYIGLYSAASPATRQAGHAWYDQAAADLAAACDSDDRDRLAAIAAHLSPRLLWSETAAVTAACWQRQAKPKGVLSGSWARACQARDAEHPLQTFGPRADKTEPFARALAGDRKALVVDIHMISAGVGQRLVHSMPSGLWARLSKACRAALPIAANWFQVEPVFLQATIWLHWLQVRP